MESDVNAIVGDGSYLTHHRLDLAETGGVLGTPSGCGQRTAAAGYDEDATAMAVEAGRATVNGSPRDDVDDRRAPRPLGEPASHVWEERFAEAPYTDHGLDVHHRTFDNAGVRRGAQLRLERPAR